MIDKEKLNLFMTYCELLNTLFSITEKKEDIKGKYWDHAEIINNAENAVKHTIKKLKMN